MFDAMWELCNTCLMVSLIGDMTDLVLSCFQVISDDRRLSKIRSLSFADYQVNEITFRVLLFISLGLGID